MKTPSDKTIAFTLVSQMTAEVERRWMARLTFPPGSDGETELPLMSKDDAADALLDKIVSLM